LLNSNNDKLTSRQGSKLNKNKRIQNDSFAIYWLRVLLFLVILMIVVGGLTRLTDSGLSITEWKPISGSIPPISDLHWIKEFNKYKLIPEYQLQNLTMDLSQFKVIYWWEWGHRQLGRLIGLVWLVGFTVLLMRKKILNIWMAKFLLVGAMGGFQGAIGWWMVSSGLQGGMLDVASYRLAIHLGWAFLILGYLSWMLLQLGHAPRNIPWEENDSIFIERLLRIFVVLVFCQVCIGALVSGIDAGKSYTDWPLMAGELIPSELFMVTGDGIGILENPAFVQFFHRTIGYCLAFLGLFIWYKVQTLSKAKRENRFNVFIGLIFLQILVGIFTLLASAPISFAIIHQSGAILLFLYSVWLLFQLQRKSAKPI
jgi:cytochrome c oxidase assembly protein subunit 15